MIDFQERVRERNAEKVADIVTVAAFLQTIEDTTQQINEAVKTLTAGKEPGTLSDMMKTALPAVGEKEFWIVAELCRIHGQNLIGAGKLLAEVVRAPDPEEKKAIDKYLKDLPRKHRKQGAPLIDGYIDSYLAALDGLNPAADKEQ